MSGLTGEAREAAQGLPVGRLACDKPPGDPDDQQRQNRHECATNQQINAVVPNPNHNNAFVYYALSGLTDVIVNLAGIQAVPIVNKSLFSSVELLVPKPPEQQRIADCLSSLDALITAETQKHEALKTHKKGLMQQLFPSPEADTI